MMNKRAATSPLRLTHRPVKYLKPPGQVNFPVPPQRRDTEPDANALCHHPTGTEAMAMQAYMLIRPRRGAPN